MKNFFLNLMVAIFMLPVFSLENEETNFSHEIETISFTQDYSPPLEIVQVNNNSFDQNQIQTESQINSEVAISQDFVKNELKKFKGYTYINNLPLKLINEDSNNANNYNSEKTKVNRSNNLYRRTILKNT